MSGKRNQWNNFNKQKVTKHLKGVSECTVQGVSLKKA